MELELEFTYQASLAPPLMIGAGPYGTRAFFEVTEGQVKGDRINGTFVGGGVVTGCSSAPTAGAASTYAAKFRPTMAQFCTSPTTGCLS